MTEPSANFVPANPGIPPDVAPDNPASEAFFSGAVRRILRSLFILGCVLPLFGWVRFGWPAAVGFALGAAISYINFRWLASAIDGLASRIVNAHSRERGGLVVVRFLVRYLLIGVAAYVIFTGWSAASKGLLFGLCMPVAAMMIEAAYELYGAVRRGL